MSGQPAVRWRDPCVCVCVGVQAIMCMWALPRLSDDKRANQGLPTREKAYDSVGLASSNKAYGVQSW